MPAGWSTLGGRLHPKDLASQAKLAVASLAASLEELEASALDIVMMHVYVVDATTDAFGQVLAAYTGAPRRCKAQHDNDRRPGALHSGNLVEIEMAVRLP